MRKALILLMAFFLLTGFEWGSSAEDDNEKQENVSSYSSQASSSSENSSSYNSKYSSRTNADAVQNVKETFASEDPDELKNRVESLARISRALKAIGQKKAS